MNLFEKSREIPQKGIKNPIMHQTLKIVRMWPLIAAIFAKDTPTPTIPPSIQNLQEALLIEEINIPTSGTSLLEQHFVQKENPEQKFLQNLAEATTIDGIKGTGMLWWNFSNAHTESPHFADVFAKWQQRNRDITLQEIKKTNTFEDLYANFEIFSGLQEYFSKEARGLLRGKFLERGLAILPNKESLIIADKKPILMNDETDTPEWWDQYGEKLGKIIQEAETHAELQTLEKIIDDQRTIWYDKNPSDGASDFERIPVNITVDTIYPYQTLSRKLLSAHNEKKISFLKDEIKKADTMDDMPKTPDFFEACRRHELEENYLRKLFTVEGNSKEKISAAQRAIAELWRPKERFEENLSQAFARKIQTILEKLKNEHVIQPEEFNEIIISVQNTMIDEILRWIKESETEKNRAELKDLLETINFYLPKVLKKEDLAMLKEKIETAIKKLDSEEPPEE